MSKCWYCNEELLLGNNTMHIGICDKCYDEMFKTGDEFLVKMTNKISSLEAKLAESEKNVEFYQERYSDATTSAYGADLIAKNIQSRLEEEIRELKQQLAEKDKAIENWQTMYQSVMQSSHNGIEEDKRLREQLKEKEKEIEKLTEELDDKNFCKDFVDLYTENKLKTQMLHENWKDKISFAVERLEKVRSFAYNTFKEFGCFDETDLEHILDNHIEELKKEMK